MKMKSKVLNKRYGGGGGGTTTKTVESIPAWARPYIEKVGKTAEAQYAQGNLGRVASASNIQQRAFNQAGNIESATSQGMSALGSQQSRLANLASRDDPNLVRQQSRLANLASRDDPNLVRQQQRLAELASTGGRDQLLESAAYQAAKNRAGITTQSGAAGTLGSARERLQTGAMEAELVDKATQQAIANRMAAEQGLGQSVQQGTATKLSAEQGLGQSVQQGTATKLSAEQGLGQSAQARQGLATGGASSLAQLGDIQRGISQQQLDTDWQALQRYASTIYGNPSRQSATQESSGGK
jgi:hypothetical protein